MTMMMKVIIDNEEDADMMAKKKKVPRFSLKLARCVKPVDGTCVAATLIRNHLEYEKLLNTKFQNS